MPIIEIQKLSHYYNGRPAVDAISWSIEEGAIVGLLGPNGAGKSTTIKMLTTLLPPSAGTAIIMGYDLTKSPSKIRQNIGYVPQMVSADGELTGYENLRLSAMLYGIPKIQREKNISQVLEFMGLVEFQDQLVRGYSGGMVRRLEIAQALVHSPSILFLDEPSVGLDPSARQSLWCCIHGWQKEFKTTILITTHGMDEADVLCDTIAFMDHGKIIALDTPEELKLKIGPSATLEDVYLHYTGVSTQEEGGDLSHARQVRRQYHG